MKKLIIMAVSLLTTSAALFAGNDSDKIKTDHQLTVINNTAFYKIVINDHIDVVLAEANDNLIEIKGEKQDVNNVILYVKKGILYINNKKGADKNGAVVYVSVTQLKQIEINGKSKVTSNGFLSSPNLKVQVNEACQFNLKNKGQIYFTSSDDVDLHFKHWRVDQPTANLHSDGI